MSDTSSGHGYMNKEDAATEFNTDQFKIESQTTHTRQMMPVRVVKVYAADGKTAATRGAVAAAGFVDLQPVISQVDGEGQKQDHGTIFHVPYHRHYGGDAAIIMDPVVGDIGTHHVADRDTSAFDDQITQGGNTQTVLPGSQRRSNMSDGVYVGGVKNATPKQYISFSDNGITVTDKSGNTIVMTASGTTITDKNHNTIVMTSSGIAVTPANNTFTITGNLKVSGTVTAGSGGGDSVGLQTHIHGSSPPPNAGT